ncbi:MAG: hypothetical protein J2O46_03770 [Nocardioides sp.]|nr:hypothetical protein [Nocardioides sp.]
MTYGAYFALAAALTVVGGIWTWFAFRRRGLRSGVRALGVTLLAPAAYLTGTLRMLGRVLDAVVSWAVHLVFSPAVWLGVAVAILGVLMIFIAGKMPKRERAARRRSEPRQVAPSPGPAPVAGGARGGDTLTDGDDLSDVAAILKKHGIS